MAIAEAVADGIRTIAATARVWADDYPRRPEQMERQLDSLREALRDAAVPLELLPGGEIALDMLPQLGDETSGASDWPAIPSTCCSRLPISSSAARVRRVTAMNFFDRYRRFAVDHPWQSMALLGVLLFVLIFSIARGFDNSPVEALTAAPLP